MVYMVGNKDYFTLLYFTYLKASVSASLEKVCWS